MTVPVTTGSDGEFTTTVNAPATDDLASLEGDYRVLIAAPDVGKGFASAEFTVTAAEDEAPEDDLELQHPDSISVEDLMVEQGQVGADDGRGFASAFRISPRI